MQDAHIQTSMQAAFAPWSMVEKWLRKAHEVDLPISISGLFGLDEVKKVVRDRQHVRDIVTAFFDKDMALKKDLAPEQRSDDNRDRIGYYWNPEFKGTPYRPSAKVIARNSQRPSKPTPHPFPHHPPSQTVIHADKALLRETPKAVELVFQGVTLIISRSEKTGNTRIIIEG
jgi:hypothetical protein